MPEYGPKPIGDAERRLGELPESAPGAILELGPEGRIVHLNRMAEQLFGYTRGEMLAVTVDALVPEALRGAHKEHRAQYHSHPVTHPMDSGLKLEARRRDGSHFPVEISLSSVKSGDGIRATAIVRGITERRQAVFDRFYQVRAGVLAGHEGAGLGLAIANRLVEQHGGRISLGNEPGNGTCVTFTIPLERSL